MAGISKIDIDFRMVMEQANHLDEVASQMEDLSEKSFGEALQDISGSWKGDNASLYIHKGNTLKENMTDTAQQLKQISDAIKKKAKFIYDTEQKAVSIAKTRSY